MSLAKLSNIFQPAIEKELKNAVDSINGTDYKELNQMIAYHMGWDELNNGKVTGGKRIRPLITLLTTASAEGEWEKALPAATAVELIHNFSLLHDDIEDKSLIRRGRPTVWSKWGLAQAINTGDSILSLANNIILNLKNTTSLQIASEANAIIQNTCLNLTKGQFLDIQFEGRQDITITDYRTMIGGKTAALISAACELGAVIAETDKIIQNHYRLFGLNLGLAYQVLDDILGIWGDTNKIGKSNFSDLATSKKSLPVLYGLELKGKFASMWKPIGNNLGEIQQLADQLEMEGGKTYSQEIADQYTNEALISLERANPQGDAGKALYQLSMKLLDRDI